MEPSYCIRNSETKDTYNGYEAPEEYKKEIRKKYTIKLVPPDNHRQNLAERAIQTFKNHFKAILAGVENTFPM